MAGLLVWCVVFLFLLSGTITLHVQPVSKSNRSTVHVLQRGIFRGERSEVIRIELTSDYCGLRVFRDDLEAAVQCYYDGLEIIGFGVKGMDGKWMSFKIIDAYLIKSWPSGSLWINRKVRDSEVERVYRFNSSLSGEVVVSYVVHSPRKATVATSTQCVRNLAFFLENGIAANKRVQYIISLVGDTPYFAFLRRLRSFENVLIRRSANFVVDLVVHGHVLPLALERKSFKYFICLNCGSRGPYSSPRAIPNVPTTLLPFTSDPKTNWIAVFASKLQGGVRAVGPTISCDVARHIQSYAMAFDRTGARVAFSVWAMKLKKSEEKDKSVYIHKMEVGLSIKLNTEGHSLTSLGFGKDFNCSDSKNLGNPTACWRNGNVSSFGCKGQDPCEVVFIKYGNTLRFNVMPAATQARVDLEDKKKCQPWAQKPVEVTRPRVFVLLTMTIDVNFRTPNYTAEGQQIDPVVRRGIYERSVRFWAVNSSLPVTVVENSGADLASLRRLVPEERRSVLNFYPSSPGTTTTLAAWR